MAVADRVCRKLSAVRSAVNIARAEPSKLTSTVLASTLSPSFTCHVSDTDSSISANAWFAHAIPQTTQGSRVIIVAFALTLSSIKFAVMSFAAFNSPPRSSISAFDTCSRIACMSGDVIFIAMIYAICVFKGYAILTNLRAE